MRRFVPLTGLFLVVLAVGCGGGGGSTPPPGTSSLPPLAMTQAATSVTTTAGVLNGSVNPNGMSTNVWFEYGTASNLAGSTLTPTQAIGSGVSAVPVNFSLNGLSGGSTYYYRVCASNTAGTTYGTITSCTTGTPGSSPTVQTLAASSITNSGASFSGSVNPNGQATQAWFEWGTGSGLASYSSTTTQSVGTGSSSVIPSASLSGLSSGTTYYYRVAASNATGTSRGSIVTFTTASPTGAPTVTTIGTTGIGSDNATLNGQVNPNGFVTTAFFEWGTDPNLTSFTSTTSQAAGSGTTSQAVTANLTGLTAGTTYYYRAWASSNAGTNKGSIASFTTGTPDAPPTVQSLGASSITQNTATMNGSVNPNGLATNSWFEWGTDPNLTSFTSTTSQAAGSGTTSQAVTANLTGLTAGTTYYYRMASSSSAGTNKGSITSFTTNQPNSPPTVQTLGAVNITQTTATMNGSINPNSLVTTAWFEWGTDHTLTIFSTTPDQSPGSGTAILPITALLSGLGAGTNYYYRVAANSSAGGSRGAILSFTTLPNPLPTTKLTVQKGGLGAGTVSGNGISCGNDCEEVITEGTVVVLTAAAENGSNFIGWTSCDSINGNSCTVTMNKDKTVAADFRWNAAGIELVSERDHIEGGMLGSKAVYADATSIYLATYQGKLFVLARDRSANFPVREVIQVTSLPLTAVRGDETNLYVTSGDGNLRVYRKGQPLILDNTISLSSFGLNSLALTNQKIYVARGSSYMSVDEDHIFLSASSEGEIVLELDKLSLTPGLTYGQTFEQNTMVVFDRKSGNRISGIANPPDIVGTTDLYLDPIVLAQTRPGPSGPGIYIYDPQNFTLEKKIARLSTNAVAQRDRWIFAGNEGGQIDVFDLGQTPSPLVSSADLRQLTGHTGYEDIEIRALWMDDHDNLIFAGSTWGNDQSRSPLLPSFFVLELRQN